MDLKEEIQNATKTDNIILGYRRSVRYIKMHKSKLVVMAGNTPENMKKELVHNAKVAGAILETFNGSSMDLGVFCGKPFPIAVLVIK